ncbi:ATP-binding protein [Hippea alviniae]|uniref:ATP-binding protein n=1 Tax=Hippea alviniae TaxID=1279027 RepID=UPI000403874C|nr:ATP-binding protein [Hippea alviniae]
MRKLTYRDGPYIDREKEEEFLLHRLNERPESILFIYGPKSSGKTTFVEYIVENILQKDERFYVNYVNFRRYAIVNYDSFLNIYFKPITEENKSMLAKMKEKFNVIISGLKGEISIPEQGINYMVSFNLYNAMQENRLDPFDLFFDILKKLREKDKTPVLIIDEVQELRDIYMNGDTKQSVEGCNRQGYSLSILKQGDNKV